MANKQIVEFSEKAAPSAADHLLIQDDQSGDFMQVSRGSLVRRKDTLQFVIGDGSGVPGTGIIGQLYLPLGSRIQVNGWRMSSLDGSSGSVQVDLWHDQNRASISDADSICGSGNEPVLSSQSENSALDLSAWTKTVLEAGCLVANLDSITSLTQVVLTLDVEITPVE
jgi:hypothetical protein